MGLTLPAFIKRIFNNSAPQDTQQPPELPVTHNTELAEAVENIAGDNPVLQKLAAAYRADNEDLEHIIIVNMGKEILSATEEGKTLLSDNTTLDKVVSKMVVKTGDCLEAEHGILSVNSVNYARYLTGEADNTSSDEPCYIEKLEQLLDKNAGNMPKAKPGRLERYINVIKKMASETIDAENGTRTRTDFKMDELRNLHTGIQDIKNTGGVLSRNDDQLQEVYATTLRHVAAQNLLEHKGFFKKVIDINTGRRYIEPATLEEG